MIKGGKRHKSRVGEIFPTRHPGHLEGTRNSSVGISWGPECAGGRCPLGSAGRGVGEEQSVPEANMASSRP